MDFFSNCEGIDCCIDDGQNETNAWSRRWQCVFDTPMLPWDGEQFRARSGTAEVIREGFASSVLWVGVFLVHV